MKKIFFIGLVFFLTHCSHAPPSQNPGAKERALYETGLKALSKNDFESANKKFSELLKKFPSFIWLDGAFYNRGLSLEGLKKYKEAAQDYSKVIELDQNSPRSQTLSDSYYRLSQCYENLGDDSKMILALLELDRDPSFLTPEVKNLELPARLAAAYARQNNLDEAEQYFKRAAVGIREFKTIYKDRDAKNWLPKTLYSMGQMRPINKNVSETEYKNYLEGLEKTQGWLVRAIEAGPSEYSQKASENLIDIYKALFDVIKDLSLDEQKDKLMAEERRQQIQRRLAGALDDTIAKLKLERLPPTAAEPEIPLLNTAFNSVLDVEKRAVQILQAPDVRDTDTAEAKAHQGLKREGRIVEGK